jgi:RHS repeat-associated protein
MTKWTDRAFTGHEQISELGGLVHMNARLYDNQIGRFLSADTIIQAPNDSQSYNRYSYVRNNPLMYTDPSGHIFGIGGSIKRQWNRSRYDVLGTVSIVVGVVLMYTPAAFLAPGFIAGGVSLLNYDQNQAQSSSNQISFSFSYTHNTSWGQNNSGLSAHQAETIRQSRAIDRLQARTSGTYNGIGGGKFANGGATNSYNNMEGDIYTGHLHLKVNRQNDISDSVHSLLTDIGSTITTYFHSLGGALAAAFGVTIDVAYYHNRNNEHGFTFTIGAVAGIDASVNVKSGFVNGDASTLDGWFTSGTTSIGPLESTGFFSGGQYVGQSHGLSFGPLPATATIAQTYTFRLPLGRLFSRDVQYNARDYLP